jgi:hypothetical protein
MRCSLLAIATFVPMVAIAQVPKAVLDELSSDLSALHKSVLEAQNKQQAPDSLIRSSNVEEIEVTKNFADIFAGASNDAKGLYKAPKGDTFKVIDKVNGWYAVKLNKQTSGLDAGWIKASDGVPLLAKTEILISPLSRSEDIYDTLLDGANKVKGKYKNNAYISVTGFSINVGVPPSVSISFAFKN